MTPTTSAHPDAAVKQMCGSSGAQDALGWGRLWKTCAPLPTQDPHSPWACFPPTRSSQAFSRPHCRSLQAFPTLAPHKSSSASPGTCKAWVSSSPCHLLHIYFLKIPELWSFLPHYADCIMEAKDIIYLWAMWQSPRSRCHFSATTRNYGHAENDNHF